MRLGMARVGDRRFLAVATAKGIVDVGAGLGSLPPNATLESLLVAGPKALAAVAKVSRDGGDPIAGATWSCPLSSPQKICGIGLNYADHAREQGLEPPKNPLLFAKYPTTLRGPDEDIVWSPALSNSVDYEAELAVVIGTTARMVPESRALEHVAGYMNANDVTARDLQKSDGQFVRAKSLDTFCPLGPYLVTRDEVPDPHRLRVQCRVNGEKRQDSNTSNLIFRVEKLVSFLSQAFTLLPGDVILTGTPSGVGMHRKPPLFLKDGDVTEVEVEAMGLLRNRCRTVTA